MNATTALSFFFSYVSSVFTCLLKQIDMAVVPVCSKTCNVHISQTVFRKGVSYSCLDKKSIRFECSSAEKQLRSLDSYFGKLPSGSKYHASSFSKNKNDDRVFDELTDQSKAKTVLSSLDEYIGKMGYKVETNSTVQSESEKELGSVDDDLSKANEDTDLKNGVEKLKNYIALQKNGGQPSLYDESSDFYLIGILSSINIAVYLFELASPVHNSDSILFSIPQLYGAKINDLIVLGEWWRLITPMFLHSGILHLALSCWAIFAFGPKVCRKYGSFTFFLIYILGGISGNILSFLHTPELTVGGTGPVFAVIGAWLICEIENRSGKDASEQMLRNAIIVTAFSCILSNFGPIDDWTHLGGACSGFALGYMTLPTLQINDSSSKDSQENGITIFARQYWDPFFVFFLFAVFVISFVFLFDPPIDALSLYRY